MLKNMFSKGLGRTAFLAVAFNMVALLTFRCSFFSLWGTPASHFSFNNFFAPTQTAFLGTGLGLAMIMLFKGVTCLFYGIPFFALTPFLRLFPTLAVSACFGKKSKLMLILPITAFILFNIHPEGRAAWMYSLMWVIPVVCYRYYNSSVLVRSFGATFAAHAVGSVLWLYVFNLPAATWIALIPVAIAERCALALGMAGTYVLFNKCYDALGTLSAAVARKVKHAKV